MKRTAPPNFDRLKALLPDRIVLHAGMMKTGSTALQNAFAANASFLLDNRVLFPRSILDRPHPLDRDRTSGHLQFVRHLRRGVPDDLLAELEASGRRPDVLFLSSEGLFHDVNDQACRTLSEVLEGRQVELFCILRSQPEWTASLYGERVVGGHQKERRSFDEFVEALIADGRLDYHQRLKQVATALGAGRVTALDHDEVLRDGGSVAAALRLLGIGEPLPLPISATASNRSSSFPEALEAHRRLNALTDGLSKDEYFSWCTQMLSGANALRVELGLATSHVGMSRELRRRMLEACREPNRRLSEAFLGGVPFGPDERLMEEPESPPLDPEILGLLMQRGAELLVAGSAARPEQQQIAALRAELADSRAATERALAAEAAAKLKARRRASLQKQLNAAERRAGKAERALARTRAQKSNLWKKHNVLELGLDVYSQELARMRDSTVWRVAAPLRALKRNHLVELQNRRRVAVARQAFAGSALFDGQWYLATYLDVAASGMDPLVHYVLFGAAEGRNPGPDFSTAAYLDRHPDLPGDITPLEHYLLHGGELALPAPVAVRVAPVAAVAPPKPVHTKPVQSKPVQSKPGRATAFTADDRTLSDTRFRMLTLGFTQRGEADMIAHAADDSRPRLRWRASWELATWNLNQGTAEGARKALEFLSVAAAERVDAEDIRKAAIARAEALRLLDAVQQGRELLLEEVSQAPHYDTYLGLASLETDLDAKGGWINAALQVGSQSAITFTPDASLQTYDRLVGAPPGPEQPPEGGPLVTILMPAYNSSGMIRTAIASIQNQSWKNFELLIIDDCSSDGTAAVARELAGTDTRIRVLETDRNAGPYVARNIALRESTGEFLTCNDADDWSHPQKIERQVSALLANPDLVANFSRQARATSDLVFYRRGQAGRYVFENMSSFMFRREMVLDALGCWDSVRFAADSEFIRRARAIFGRERVTTVDSGPLSFQRQSEMSLTGHSAFGYHGFYMGARQEYFERQFEYHRGLNVLRYEFPQRLRPFPVPEPMWPEREATVGGRRHFDVVIAMELRLPDEAVNARIAEILALRRLDLRVGLVKMSRYDLPATLKSHSKIIDLLRDGTTQVLVSGEKISCDLLIVRDASVLWDWQEFVPDVEAGAIHAVAMQLPPAETAPGVVSAGTLRRSAEHLRKLFNKDGVWHPAGPALREALQALPAEELDAIELSPEDWPDIADSDAWQCCLQSWLPERRTASTRLATG